MNKDLVIMYVAITVRALMVVLQQFGIFPSISHANSLPAPSDCIDTQRMKIDRKEN